MTSHEFIEYSGADKQSRFYIDGQRVSEGYFRSLKSYLNRMDSIWSRTSANSRITYGFVGYLD